MKRLALFIDRHGLWLIAALALAMLASVFSWTPAHAQQAEKPLPTPTEYLAGRVGAVTSYYEGQIGGLLERAQAAIRERDAARADLAVARKERDEARAALEAAKKPVEPGK